MKLLSVTSLVALCISICACSQANEIQMSGDILQVALPVSAVGAMLCQKDWEGLVDFGIGYGVGMGTTRALKLTDASSGHTTSAFYGAETIRKKYGAWYGIPAYALAGWTGYTRLYAEKHDEPEVIVGAIVGITSAWFFTGNDIKLAPYKQIGAQISMAF